jgi:hypothetical protein
VGGTITNSGVLNSGAAARLVFSSGSTYNHASYSQVVPWATWNDNSACNVTGAAGTVVGVGGSNTNFYNFDWNSSYQSAYSNGVFTTAATQIRNNFYFDNSNNQDVVLSTVNNAVFTVGGE